MEYLKEVDEQFSKLLTEEMGIIRNVQNNAKEISYRILDSIKTTRSVPTSLNYTTHKYGTFNTNVIVSADDIKEEPIRKEITVKWYYYSFVDLQTQLEQLKNIPYKTKYGKKSNTLSVVILAIKGKVDNRTLIDSVAHELTHNFHTNIKGGELITSTNKLNVYQNANVNISNNDDAYKWIANVIYLTNSFEQDAFLNGAYAYIMKQYEEGHDFMKSYSETEAYVSLHKMRYYLNAMQSALKYNNISDRVRSHCQNEYGYSFEKIVNYGEKAYARYSKKLARMCGQALNDIDKQEKMHVPYHTMEFFEPKGLNEVINKFESDFDFFSK